MDRLRMQYMVAQASLGRGLQIIYDTGFLPRKGPIRWVWPGSTREPWDG